jgi:putative flippase GtrA
VNASNDAPPTSAQRFLRFMCVGAAGFLVNEAALWIALQAFHLNAYVAGLCSFFVAVTFTWWGNRTFTFRENAARGRNSIATEWAKFVAANGLGFAINYAIYATMISVAPPPANSPFLALAAGTLAGLTINFALSSRLVFRSEHDAEPK